MRRGTAGDFEPTASPLALGDPALEGCGDKLLRQWSKCCIVTDVTKGAITPCHLVDPPQA
jgi:hypothetical protein